MPKVGEASAGVPIGSWPALVNATVAAYQAAREAKLDAVLTEPFDAEAHSTQIEVGTRVAYAKQFLRSINAKATDPMWFARGTVQQVYVVGDSAIVVIEWDDDWKGYPTKVHAANLARVGPNLKFCGD